MFSERFSPTLICSQVYHDLLHSEEEFANELRTIVEIYVKALDEPNIPEEVKGKKDELAMNLKQLHNFHAKYELILRISSPLPVLSRVLNIISSKFTFKMLSL